MYYTHPRWLLVMKSHLTLNWPGLADLVRLACSQGGNTAAGRPGSGRRHDQSTGAEALLKYIVPLFNTFLTVTFVIKRNGRQFKNRRHIITYNNISINLHKLYAFKQKPLLSVQPFSCYDITDRHMCQLCIDHLIEVIYLKNKQYELKCCG